MQVRAHFGCLLLCLAVCGCNQPNWQEIRQQHATRFPQELRDKTVTELPGDQTFGLEDCVRIALANNLDVQTAQINRRLASLDRKIAFSNFLPHINVGVQYHSSARQQAIGVGGQYMPMSDRSVTEAVLSAQQSIFAPETWFLYDAYVKGEGVSDLVAKRTRDLIRLQVTTLYFACLSQEQSRSALEASLEQARTLLREMEALAREGLAMPSQVEQVRTLVAAQQAGLADNARAQREMRAALLEAMGLSPTAEIVLKAQTPLMVQQQEASEQILQAMLHRPELHIADRTIAIREDETRIAIAQFLPKIAGFSNLSHSTDSFLKYSTMWTAGISGVLSVFDGFANVHAYRAAREREKQAAIDRERKCLQIMLEVIRARARYDQALDGRKVALQELAAAKALLDETRARWREGFLMTSEMRDAMTRHATALANATAADFQCQVAAATLLDVMGMPHEGNRNEEVK